MSEELKRSVCLECAGSSRSYFCDFCDSVVAKDPLTNKGAEPLESLVLKALSRGLMIHGLGGQAMGDNGMVYSVVVSGASKRKIVVYGADSDKDHASALRKAISKAILEMDSRVVNIKG